MAIPLCMSWKHVTAAAADAAAGVAVSGRHARDTRSRMKSLERCGAHWRLSHLSHILRPSSARLEASVGPVQLELGRTGKSSGAAWTARKLAV